MNEQQCLIKENPKDTEDTISEEEEWSEDESSSNSNYSDSDR